MDNIWTKVERKRKERNSDSKSPSCVSPAYKRPNNHNMASPTTEVVLSTNNTTEHIRANAKSNLIEQLLTEGGNNNEALINIASFMKELSIDVRKIRDSQTACRAEISQISEDLADVDEKLEKCNVAVEVIHEDLGSVKGQNVELKDKQHNICSKIDTVEKRLVQMENKLEAFENQGRRNNLVLYDIPEEDSETWEQTEQKVRGFVTDELKIRDPSQNPTPISIDRAYRMGPKRRGQTLVLFW
jgi:chromosome segregation ATPase